MALYSCRFNVLYAGNLIGLLRPCSDVNPSVSSEFCVKKKIEREIANLFQYYYMYSRDIRGPWASCFKLRPVVNRFLEYMRNLQVQCNNYRHAY